MRVDCRACGQVLSETRLRERPAMLGVLEELVEPISVLAIDQQGRLRRIVQAGLCSPRATEPGVASRAGGVFQRKLAILTRTHNGDVSAAAQCRAQQRGNCRKVY